MRRQKQERIQQLRRVSGVPSATSVIMRLQPDMIISRDDAMLLGFSVFRTGKKCKNGHRDWRYTTNTLCLECNRERARKYPDNPKIGDSKRTAIKKLR